MLEVKVRSLPSIFSKLICKRDADERDKCLTRARSSIVLTWRVTRHASALHTSQHPPYLSPPYLQIVLLKLRLLGLVLQSFLAHGDAQEVLAARKRDSEMLQPHARRFGAVLDFIHLKDMKRSDARKTVTPLLLLSPHPKWHALDFSQLLKWRQQIIKVGRPWNTRLFYSGLWTSECERELATFCQVAPPSACSANPNQPAPKKITHVPSKRCRWPFSFLHSSRPAARARA